MPGDVPNGEVPNGTTQPTEPIEPTADDDDDDEVPDSLDAAEPGDELSADSTVAKKATEVEGAMGGVIDELQTALGFPTDDAGKKASETFNYAVSAQGSFVLKKEWEILSGLKLQAVKLNAIMGKRSGQPGKADFLSPHDDMLDLANCGIAGIASFGFELMAYFKVKEVDVLVTGKIPNIQEGRDVEIVLSLRALQLLDSLDTKALLGLCADTQASMKEGMWT